MSGLFGGEAGGTAAGGNTQLQFNDGGAFGGASGLTWNKSTSAFGLSGSAQINAGTLESSVSAFGIAATWGGGGTHTGLLLDVTDTSSAADSLLANFRVGLTSCASIGKTGTINAGRADAFSPVGLNLRYGSGIGSLIQANGVSVAAVNMSNAPGGRPLLSAEVFGLCSTLISAADVFLVRAAPNTLALRNAANAQTLRINGTHTDGSNGRWLEATMSTAGIAAIRPTGNGTGASGNVLHISGLPTSNPGPGILWNNAGTPAIGT